MFIDLHRHIEGTIRPQTIFQMLQSHRESVCLEELIREMQVDGSERTLMDFISKLGTRHMKRVVKTGQELEVFGYEAVEDAYKQEIIYLELRACPLPIHQANRDISIQQYIRSVRDGMLAAEKFFDIKTNLIISIKREDDFVENRRLANEIIEAYEDGLVCGADLCGNEPLYPTRRYEDIFKRLRRAKVPLTIHAGEAATHDSIEEALNLGAKRIGHATNLYKAKELMTRIKREGIGLECCITSNLHTRAINKIEEHPIKIYLNKGIKTSFNTDDPITSQTTIGDEARILTKRLNVNGEELDRMLSDAIEMSFATPDEKALLIKKINSV